jgi:hypothetical protein
MTNTDTAIANYVRKGGNAKEGRTILADNISTYGASFNVIQATLMEHRMATVKSVERITLGILEELAA